MTAHNPYASPKANLLSTGEKCTRDGKWVIVPEGSDLPARCIVCNDAIHTPIKSKKLYWHNPWVYLFILLNILIYIIAGLIARKTTTVSPGMCALHLQQRRKRLLIMVGAAVALEVLGCYLLAIDFVGVALVCMLAGLFLLIAAALVGRKVYPKKITKEFSVIGGCKEPFLSSLDGKS